MHSTTLSYVRIRYERSEANSNYMFCPDVLTWYLKVDGNGNIIKINILSKGFQKFLDKSNLSGSFFHMARIIGTVDQVHKEELIKKAFISYYYYYL